MCADSAVQSAEQFPMLPASHGMDCNTQSVKRHRNTVQELMKAHPPRPDLGHLLVLLEPMMQGIVKI